MTNTPAYFAETSETKKVFIFQIEALNGKSQNLLLSPFYEKDSIAFCAGVDQRPML